MPALSSSGEGSLTPRRSRSRQRTRHVAGGQPEHEPEPARARLACRRGTRSVSSLGTPTTEARPPRPASPGARRGPRIERPTADRQQVPAFPPAGTDAPPPAPGGTPSRTPQPAATACRSQARPQRRRQAGPCSSAGSPPSQSSDKPPPATIRRRVNYTPVPQRPLTRIEGSLARDCSTQACWRVSWKRWGSVRSSSHDEHVSAGPGSDSAWRHPRHAATMRRGHGAAHGVH